MSQQPGPDAGIFIVDDDPAVRDALAIVLEQAGFRVEGFEDGAGYLKAVRDQLPACTILDVQMAGRTGLEILRELNAEQFPSPIVIISGQGDIPKAVEAIKLGAFDFIEKPFDAQTVVVRVREAIEACERRGRAPPPADLSKEIPGYNSLTRREVEVLEQISAGASNKEAGRELGISPRTIEVHRARIMEKLGAKNTADLVRIVLGAKRKP